VCETGDGPSESGAGEFDVSGFFPSARGELWGLGRDVEGREWAARRSGKVGLGFVGDFVGGDISGDD